MDPETSENAVGFVFFNPSRWGVSFRLGLLPSVPKGEELSSRLSQAETANTKKLSKVPGSQGGVRQKQEGAAPRTCGSEKSLERECGCLTPRQGWTEGSKLPSERNNGRNRKGTKEKVEFARNGYREGKELATVSGAERSGRGGKMFEDN